jgi:hypothetical protein
VVLLLEAGNAFSWFGYGLILAFEIIYLYQFGGFSPTAAVTAVGRRVPGSAWLESRFGIDVGGQRHCVVFTCSAVDRLCH